MNTVCFVLFRKNIWRRAEPWRPNEMIKYAILCHVSCAKHQHRAKHNTGKGMWRSIGNTHSVAQVHPFCCWISILLQASTSLGDIHHTRSVLGELLLRVWSPRVYQIDRDTASNVRRGPVSSSRQLYHSAQSRNHVNKEVNNGRKGAPTKGTFSKFSGARQMANHTSCIRILKAHDQD